MYHEPPDPPYDAPPEEAPAPPPPGPGDRNELGHQRHA